MKKKFTIFVVLLAGIIYTGHAQGVQWIYQQKQEKKNMKNLSEYILQAVVSGEQTIS